MTRSSGLIGCPPRLRPFASRLGPCRISASHSQSQQLLTSVCSLLELNLSLRVPSSFALSVPCSPTKVARSSQTPLLRSLPLQRSQAEATGGLALSCPSAATFHSHSVPPSPFLTTSTASYASTPLEVSLESHSWGFSLQGSPASLRTQSSLTSPSLLTFLASAPAFTGMSCLTLHLRRAFRALLLRLDRHRQLLVSLPLGLVTLLGFYLVGPRFPGGAQTEVCLPPEPYGPVTCPELKKSNNVLDRKSVV